MSYHHLTYCVFSNWIREVGIIWKDYKILGKWNHGRFWLGGSIWYGGMDGHVYTGGRNRNGDDFWIEIKLEWKSVFFVFKIMDNSENSHLLSELLIAFKSPDLKLPIDHFQPESKELKTFRFEFGIQKHVLIACRSQITLPQVLSTRKDYSI